MSENKPVKKFTSGAVSASIFENVNEKDGKQFTVNSVVVQRAYTKDEGKTFEHTSSMRENDLPKVALVVGKAYEYLALKKDE